MKLFSAATPTEAHIVCELLRSEGIECEVRGEGIFGLQGEIPLGECSEPYVWLLDADQSQQAQRIIAQYQQANSGSHWLCRQCGEDNEPQFGACWQCGSVSP